jgi:RES domain-containing protein
MTALSRRFWRILSPRWQHAPLSGEGAARHGGRWNRPGHAALYMSETIETAFAEYQQEIGVRPGTFVAYDVVGAQVADLTRAEEVSREELLAPWKEAAFVRKVDPASWRLVDQLRPRADGVRVPSAQYQDGVNLVLWRWNESGGPKVTYLDPNRDLGGRP